MEALRGRLARRTRRTTLAVFGGPPAARRLLRMTTGSEPSQDRRRRLRTFLEGLAWSEPLRELEPELDEGWWIDPAERGRDAEVHLNKALNAKPKPFRIKARDIAFDVTVRFEPLAAPSDLAG